jgi:hypothetical protein
MSQEARVLTLIGVLTSLAVG